MNTFQTNLKALMQERKWSQKQLSEISGIPSSSIGMWLGSRSSLPNIETASILADVFGCTIDYLVGRESEDGVIIVSENNDYTQNEKDLIEVFRQLSVRQQYAALGFMKGMLAG